MGESKAKKKRTRPRKTAESTARGRNLALVLTRSRVRYSDARRQLEEEFRVCEKTAKNWLAWAKTQLLHEEHGIDLESVAETRSSEVPEWARRRAEWRQRSEDAYACGNMRDAHAHEQKALEYDKLIGRATGINDFSVIDDLSDDKRRQMVVAAVVQNIDQLAPSDLKVLETAIAERRTREGKKKTSRTEAEAQHVPAAVLDESKALF